MKQLFKWTHEHGEWDSSCSKVSFQVNSTNPPVRKSWIAAISGSPFLGVTRFALVWRKKEPSKLAILGYVMQPQRPAPQRLWTVMKKWRVAGRRGWALEARVLNRSFVTNFHPLICQGERKITSETDLRGSCTQILHEVVLSFYKEHFGYKML